MTFKEKYLKYKQKYVELKKELESRNNTNQQGGFNENSEVEDFDFKLSPESEIDQNSIEELKKQLNDLEGGDAHDEFEFDIKLDHEGDFEVDDELTDLEELFEKIDENEPISDKELKEFEDL